MLPQCQSSAHCTSVTISDSSAAGAGGGFQLAAIRPTLFALAVVRCFAAVPARAYCPFAALLCVLVPAPMERRAGRFAVLAQAQPLAAVLAVRLIFLACPHCRLD